MQETFFAYEKLRRDVSALLRERDAMVDEIEALQTKCWKQHYMADKVVSTLGSKGVEQGAVSNWSRKGFVITADGWIINPKTTCQLIEKHWSCNENGGDNE